MKRSESSGVLPQEKHGDRSGHMSINVAVLRSLFFDYVIKTRRRSSLGSYDTASCYVFV